METEIFDLLTTQSAEQPTKTNPQKGVAKYDWTAAFVEYCRGTSIADCALIFGIPVDSLRNYAASQKWETLKSQKALVPNAPNSLKSSEELERKARLSREIREDVLQGVKNLLIDAIRVTESIRDGTASKEKQFHNKGEIIRADVPLELADRQIAAQYLSSVANIAYSALGESSGAAGAAKLGNAESGGNPAQSVTIILPGVIGAPRQERETVTIDLGQPVARLESQVDASTLTNGH